MYKADAEFDLLVSLLSFLFLDIRKYFLQLISIKRSKGQKVVKSYMSDGGCACVMFNPVQNYVH